MSHHLFVSENIKKLALDAVQDFSFGSKENENVFDIDDVDIANNIAMCANEDEEAESFGYKWTWEDGEIQEQEVRSKLNDFRKRKVESFRVSTTMKYTFRIQLIEVFFCFTVLNHSSN